MSIGARKHRDVLAGYEQLILHVLKREEFAVPNAHTFSAGCLVEAIRVQVRIPFPDSGFFAFSELVQIALLHDVVDGMILTVVVVKLLDSDILVAPAFECSQVLVDAVLRMDRKSEIAQIAKVLRVWADSTKNVNTWMNYLGYDSNYT